MTSLTMQLNRKKITVGRVINDRAFGTKWPKKVTCIIQNVKYVKQVI